MKKTYITLLAAAIASLSLGITAQAQTTYTLEITNQYDEDGTSRDDNDKDRVRPLAPDVELGESDMVELVSDVDWSKDSLNWTAGNEVTGTVYIGSEVPLSAQSLEAKVTNGRNDAEVTSVKKYTGDEYETDMNYIYTVKFKYQSAVKLGETTWAGWDSAASSTARWNPVKFANTYRVTLYDDQGSVVTQLVEDATSYDFSQFMTKSGIQYYFEVTAIARNGNQQDYLEDGEPVSSLSASSSHSYDPGITDGTWGEYQEGWRFTYKDGTAAVSRWERINGKWYYFNDQGIAVTGWNQIGGAWYFMYDDCSMAAGTTTPDGYQVDESGAWVQ